MFGVLNKIVTILNRFIIMFGVLNKGVHAVELLCVWCSEQGIRVLE